MPADAGQRVAHHQASRLLDREDLRRLQHELEVGDDDRFEFESLRPVNGEDANGVASLIEEAGLDVIRDVATALDLVDELSDRSADFLVVGKGNGAHVLEMTQR